jgi:hypothetical protein
MTLLVYAVRSHSAVRGLPRGITNERLRRVRAGSIDAIVGSVRATPRPTERNLRKFDDVVSELWSQTHALLPVRFGTVVRDDTEIEAAIGEQRASLGRRLRAVRNRAQMTLRVPLVKSESSNPKSHSGGSGAAYLRARARAAREVPGFSTVRNAAKRWVRAERVEKRAGVASIYHLVPFGSVRSYRRAVEAAARDAGLRVLMSGPWPPYAFGEDW